MSFAVYELHYYFYSQQKHYLDDGLNNHILPSKYLCNNDKTEGHGTLPEKEEINLLQQITH